MPRPPNLCAEIEQLRREVELLEMMVRLVDRGTATPYQEKSLAKATLAELAKLRNGQPSVVPVR